MPDINTCLQQIASLSNETSSDVRRQVLKRVTDLFLMTNDRQSVSDVTVFGTVMERIGYELEVEARAELSERISGLTKAPRRLVHRLAKDEIVVARPVLENSSVLTDEDLIEIAKTRGQTHLLAISRRTSLSAPLTDVIVERGENPVLLEVSKNKGAEFSQAGLGTLAQKANSDTRILKALEKRHDLTPKLMEQIKQRVAQKIKNEMGGRFDPSNLAEIDTLVDRTADNLDIDRLTESNEILRQKALKQELTQEEIVTLARSGQLNETVHALSILSGLDDRMVSYSLLKGDIATLGVLCKANNFNGATFLALMQIRSGKDRIAARDVARAMRDYENLKVENAQRTLRFLKVRKSLDESTDSTPRAAS